MFGDIRKSRIIAYSAAFIGLISIGGWVSVPFFPVPLTLQTLFFLLAGAVMKRYAILPGLPVSWFWVHLVFPCFIPEQQGLVSC